MTTNDQIPNTRQKALRLNLDGRAYGTFAEIGGGQEVARWFFTVGAAAGTVAKTISAYDMAVSDSIYGPAKRYVSRERLEAMLASEFKQVTDQLGVTRGNAKRFFAFASTVATKKFHAEGTGRGWMGVRFQAEPRQEPSEIIIHAHLLDLGVNLVYAAFYHDATDPAALIASLSDDLPRRRVEIDMIKLSGPAFAGVDNRLMSLQLVELGLTDAAMFTATPRRRKPSAPRGTQRLRRCPLRCPRSASSSRRRCRRSTCESIVASWRAGSSDRA